MFNKYRPGSVPGTGKKKKKKQKNIKYTRFPTLMKFAL